METAWKNKAAEAPAEPAASGTGSWRGGYHSPAEGSQDAAVGAARCCSFPDFPLFSVFRDAECRLRASAPFGVSLASPVPVPRDGDGSGRGFWDLVSPSSAFQEHRSWGVYVVCVCGGGDFGISASPVEPLGGRRPSWFVPVGSATSRGTPQWYPSSYHPSAGSRRRILAEDPRGHCQRRRNHKRSAGGWPSSTGVGPAAKLPLGRPLLPAGSGTR